LAYWKVCSLENRDKIDRIINSGRPVKPVLKGLENSVIQALIVALRTAE
jgi:hypothetical protein